MKREMMGLIVKRDDGSEIVNYDDPAFPSYIYEGWVAPKVTWERVPHYHEDIEMICVTSGKMGYSVNGKTVMLHEGDVIFVNSNQIHYSMCVDDQGARYVIFVFRPSIISTSLAVEMSAVLPITENPDLPYIKFYKMNENTTKLGELMRSLPDIRHDPFRITKTLFSIWEIILKQSSAYGALTADEEQPDTHNQAFKTMMYYIQQEYRNPITLDDIASSANISRSLCNKIFNLYVEESPISYVMHFRARKAAEYLRAGSCSMNQIAEMTGFGGASYMAEIFKKFFGTSPAKYRKKWADPELVDSQARERT